MSPTTCVKPCPGRQAILGRREHACRGTARSRPDTGGSDRSPDATRSSGSRLISRIELAPSSTKPSGPSTRIASSQRRTSSMPKRSSNSRMNGPIAHERVVVLGLAEQQRAAALEVAQVDVVAERRADASRPRLFTASTISGSGLFHSDFGWMPMSAPRPTADIGCDLVKISASGPMPTSRYCDHARCAISASFTRAASGEPGRTAARLSPMIATIERRTDSAFAGSPRACSSITRSSMLDTKVTPAALIACRSHGASSQGRCASRAGSDELASTSASDPMICARPMPARNAATGSSSSSRSRIVGATRDRSSTSLPRTTTGSGPPASVDHARPTRVACARSRGRDASGSRREFIGRPLDEERPARTSGWQDRCESPGRARE